MIVVFIKELTEGRTNDTQIAALTLLLISASFSQSWINILGQLLKQAEQTKTL